MRVLAARPIGAALSNVAKFYIPSILSKPGRTVKGSLLSTLVSARISYRRRAYLRPRALPMEMVRIVLYLYLESLQSSDQNVQGCAEPTRQHATVIVSGCLHFIANAEHFENFDVHCHCENFRGDTRRFDLRRRIGRQPRTPRGYWRESKRDVSFLGKALMQK